MDGEIPIQIDFGSVPPFYSPSDALNLPLRLPLFIAQVEVVGGGCEFHSPELINSVRLR